MSRFATRMDQQQEQLSSIQAALCHSKAAWGGFGASVFLCQSSSAEP
jgi:hypothetical protein